jgi:hypothetical protein
MLYMRLCLDFLVVNGVGFDLSIGKLYRFSVNVTFSDGG